MPGLVTYARAALPLVPLASRLPFVAGGGGDMPEGLERDHTGVSIDRDHLAAYARVCGFRVRDALAPTYPHILAFPLHMDVMTDGHFPFGAVGLVHIGNTITVHRPLDAAEELDIHVAPGAVTPHPRGRQFSLRTEVRSGSELVWEEKSTMLRRGGGSGSGNGSSAKDEDRAPAPPAGAAEWSLPGDLGRRYASVSGDRNPIHLHALSARLFGFPRAIAHGMWTKARALAALEAELPDAYTVSVRFRKPILLPSRVEFGARDGRFAVHGAGKPDKIHLEGSIQ